MKPNSKKTTSRRIAIVGAGMAGVTAARTLEQAGHTVTVFEKNFAAGGRMATCETLFGNFDHGAQYFTVRDARFTQAMQYALAADPKACKPWSANAVRVLDAGGQVAAAALPAMEPHWVAAPGMNALPKLLARPLENLMNNQLVTNIAQKGNAADAPWTVSATGPDGKSRAHGDFDAVLLALPAPWAMELLHGVAAAKAWQKNLAKVDMAPCWTLMLAFPNASQPDLTTLGPQWNAARSTHHRVAWLARESSKPQRSKVERWTVQASAEWSREHLTDSPSRIVAKLGKAFAELTGIRAQATHAVAHRWQHAKTQTPLGSSHLWNAQAGLGLCGDWCLGHRVENAFVSGLELALAVA